MKTINLPQQELNELVTPAIIRGIVSAISERFSPEMIILFGSYASGQATPDSDLDLLIVMDTDLPFRKRATGMQLLFVPMPCSIDMMIFTPREVAHWQGTPNHIITEALRTGRIVYERTNRKDGHRVAQESTK